MGAQINQNQAAIGSLGMSGCKANIKCEESDQTDSTVICEFSFGIAFLSNACMDASRVGEKIMARRVRHGYPETLFSIGKTVEQVVGI